MKKKNLFVDVHSEDNNSNTNYSRTHACQASTLTSESQPSLIKNF
jgi:hypothetical protein